MAALMTLNLGWTDAFAANQSVTFRAVKILVRSVIKTVTRSLQKTKVAITSTC